MIPAWFVGFVLLVSAPFTSLDDIDKRNPEVTLATCEGGAPAFLADFAKDETTYRMLVNVDGTRFILIDFTHSVVWFGTIDSRSLNTESERALDDAIRTYPNPCTYLYPTPVTIQTRS